MQQMFGYSLVGITLDRYSYALPVLQEEAAANLDALLAVDAASRRAEQGTAS